MSCLAYSYHHMSPPYLSSHLGYNKNWVRTSKFKVTQTLPVKWDNLGLNHSSLAIVGTVDRAHFVVDNKHTLGHDQNEFKQFPSAKASNFATRKSCVRAILKSKLYFYIRCYSGPFAWMGLYNKEEDSLYAVRLKKLYLAIFESKT